MILAVQREIKKKQDILSQSSWPQFPFFVGLPLIHLSDNRLKISTFSCDTD